MPANRIMQIVASESTPEKEAEFDKWYTDIHVPMLFGYKGVKQVSRYRRLGNDENSAKFLAIYEFKNLEDMEAFPESPEFAEAIEDFEKNKESMGFNMKWVSSYELIKSWER